MLRLGGNGKLSGVFLCYIIVILKFFRFKALYGFAVYLKCGKLCRLRLNYISVLNFPII